LRGKLGAHASHLAASLAHDVSVRAVGSGSELGRKADER
jgi:hypothetical protein